jgi:hypothetical protein
VDRVRTQLLCRTAVTDEEMRQDKLRNLRTLQLRRKRLPRLSFRHLGPAKNGLTRFGCVGRNLRTKAASSQARQPVAGKPAAGQSAGPSRNIDWPIQRVFGGPLSSCTKQTEATEVTIASAALNQMPAFRRPKHPHIAYIIDRVRVIVPAVFRNPPPFNTVLGMSSLLFSSSWLIHAPCCTTSNPPIRAPCSA